MNSNNYSNTRYRTNNTIKRWAKDWTSLHPRRFTNAYQRIKRSLTTLANREIKMTVTMRYRVTATAGAQRERLKT